MAIAWRGPGEAPPVAWVVGGPCVLDSPWPAIRVGAVCAAGTWDGARATVVEVPPELGAPFSDSALAHEFMHAKLERETSDMDAAHRDPQWAEIPAINDQLRQEGL